MGIGSKRLTGLGTALAVLLLTAPALAKPGRGPHHDPAQREELLRKVHTMRIVELGQLLELDTAGTLRLAERLKPFEEERVRLRLESFEAMQTLRRAKSGDASADAVAAARSLAEKRVKLAEVDQRELEAVLKGLSPEQGAKVALFMAQFPRRIEKMARELHRRRHHAD